MQFPRPSDRFSIERFSDCEDGAVTVDWVVLTAATVGLALGLFSVITEGHFMRAAEAITADIDEAAR
ncbi:MAG: hypothetical protein Q7V11_18735, partial [Pseudotabrizicola sp.]|nr:hypothetical protein [Pseudotabrizicola sp.]